MRPFFLALNNYKSYFGQRNHFIKVISDITCFLKLTAVDSTNNMGNGDGDEKKDMVELKSETTSASVILGCLDTGHFTHVVLVGDNGVTVICHRLVLASASVYLRQLLLQQTGEGGLLYFPFPETFYSFKWL